MGFDRDDILRTFLADSEDILTATEASLVELVGRPTPRTSIEPLLRGLHTLKGNAMVLDLTEIVGLAHALEEQLGRMEEEGTAVVKSVQPLLQGVDALRRALPAAAGPRRLLELPDEVPAEPMSRRFGGDDAALTPRIDIEKLDRLLALVGELAVAHGRIRSLLKGPQGGPRRESVEACDEIDRIHLLLQDQVLGLRTIPLGPVLRRYIRLTSDLAAENGKLARLELAMEPSDVEVDTRVVVQLRDPLVHMIRNAIDHGIEEPDVRQAFGKDPTGTLTLRAFRDPDGIVIELSDDGAGLQRDRILARARERGLVGPAESPGDDEICELIFRHGFSTAERVSAISGRGVGMDVVRQNIEAIRGSVAVESREGEGTKFTIRLPLRVAIIGCLQVGVGSEEYLLPLDDVVECLDLPAERRDTNGALLLNLRGHPVPLVPLRSALSLGGPRPDRESVVLVKHPRGPVGVVVDFVAGQIQAVVKPLGYPFHHVEGVGSAAFLPSGRVALVLDVVSLLQHTFAPREGARLKPLPPCPPGADTHV